MFGLVCASLWAGALLSFTWWYKHVCRIVFLIYVFQKEHAVFFIYCQKNKPRYFFNFYTGLKRLKHETRGLVKYLTNRHCNGIFLANQNFVCLCVDGDNNQVKTVLGSLPVYIWWTVWNAQRVFSGRCLNWQRESISHAKLIRVDFAPIEILLCFWARRAHLSLNFADCRPAERRYPPRICKYVDRIVNKEKRSSLDWTNSTLLIFAFENSSQFPICLIGDTCQVMAT